KASPIADDDRLPRTAFPCVTSLIASLSSRCSERVGGLSRARLPGAEPHTGGVDRHARTRSGKSYSRQQAVTSAAAIVEGGTTRRAAVLMWCRGALARSRRPAATPAGAAEAEARHEPRPDACCGATLRH